MDVRELRIGNLIEWNKQPFKVCRIFTDSIENEFWCKPLNELHPIPLTEEWLLKMGFEKEECSARGISIWNEWNIGSFYISSEGTEGEYKNKFILIIPNMDNVIVEHVHQLQNLYWCLTGKELETI